MHNVRNISISIQIIPTIQSIVVKYKMDMTNPQNAPMEIRTNSSHCFINIPPNTDSQVHLIRGGNDSTFSWYIEYVIRS